MSTHPTSSSVCRPGPVWRSLVFLCCVIGANAVSARLTAEDSMTFMSTLVAEASAALSAGNGSLEQREAAFRKLLQEGFDMPLIARVSLGKYWPRITEAEQAAYVELFGEFVLKSYGPRLASFDSSKFHVTDAVERGKQDMLVNTRIDQPSGPPIEASWRVRDVDGKPRIVDIVVEGVSMALNQRHEFVSVVSRSGMTGLLELLRARTQRLTVQPPS